MKKETKIITKRVKKDTKDLLRHNFVVGNQDHVWTLDFTVFLGSKNNKYPWLLTIMDLASRKIIFHEIIIHPSPKGSPFTTHQTIQCIDTAMRNTQKPKLIHTDLGTQFTSQEFSDFLSHHLIQQSLGDQEVFKNSNQTHESFHFVLKTLAKKELKTLLKLEKTPRNFESLDNFNNFEILDFIQNCINIYNNKPHSSLYEASPNITETALALFLPEPTDGSILKAKTGTTKANKILELKQQVLQKYAGDWAAFFVEWQENSKLQHQRVLNEIRNSAQDTITVLGKKQVELLDYIDNLEKIIQEQKANVEHLVNVEKRKEIEAKLAEERKTLRKNRTRIPARDAAACAELKTAFDFTRQTKCPEFAQSRDRVVLFILYISGLRLTNTLFLTANHLEQILLGNSFSIPLIKQGGLHKIHMTPSFNAIAESIRPDFLALLQNKTGDDCVITQENRKEPIHRVSLAVRINNILKSVGKHFHKKITSHSFRIGLTTAIAETSGLEAARMVIGHKDIRSTAVYSRHLLTHEAAIKILNAAERKKIPRHYKKRSVLL
jgi:site-specific recombinase XerC